MKKPTHILVIRLSAMGDVAMTVPVLRVFKQTYPTVKITVLSKAFFKPFFIDIPEIEFLEADVYGEHKGIKGLLKLAKKAQRLEIDAIADLHNVIRSKTITKYLNLKGIKSVTINKGRAEKKALTRAKNKTFKKLKMTHQRYVDVFTSLGFPLDLDTYKAPSKKTLSPYLQGLVKTIQKKQIGIAPFAAFKSKTYPLDLMKEVIAMLDKTERFNIFLFGGGTKEIEILKEIEKQHSSVLNMAGKLPLEEELSLISNLDLMVSMDSGNGHLAAMYGVPVLSLWGVTHPFAGFAPFGQKEENNLLADRNKFPLIPTSVYGNKYPEGYQDVMKTISTEVVFKRVLAVV
jgi:ADP-heptose:LPS heptosyltransferase